MCNEQASKQWFFLNMFGRPGTTPNIAFIISLSSLLIIVLSQFSKSTACVCLVICSYQNCFINHCICAEQKGDEHLYALYWNIHWKLVCVLHCKYLWFKSYKICDNLGNGHCKSWITRLNSFFKHSIFSRVKLVYNTSLPRELQL